MAFDLEELTIDAARKIVGNAGVSIEQWGQWLRMWWNAEESRNRKESVKRLIDYYEGRQLKYLEDLLRNQYEDADELGLQLEFTNILRMIIDRLSIIYKDGARRDLIGANVTDEERKLWEWIQSSGRLERNMDTVNKLVNLTGTVLVRPRYNEDTDSFAFDVLTPDVVDVIPRPDDPSEAMSVSYATSDGEYFFRNSPDKRNISNVYHYWDRESYFTFDTGNHKSQSGIHDNPDNPENINPYGELPFVRFTSTMPRDGFFVDIGDDMIIAQDMVNLKLVELNYLLKMQCFSVPVLVGYEADASEKIVVSPGRPIVIPRSEGGEQDADFRFESPNPNIQALTDEIANKLSRLARTYGLSDADFRVSGSAMSGLSLRIQNRHLQSRFNRELAYYEDGEQEVFGIVKRVWNYHRQFLPSHHAFRDVKFQDDTVLSVTIHSPSFEDNPNETREWWDFMLKGGLATPIDFYMKHMNMTEEQAQSHWQKVKLWAEKNEWTTDGGLVH